MGKMDISPKELERLMNMAESALFIAKADSDMQIIYANDRFYSILKYTREEYMEQFDNNFMSAVLPEEKQKLRNLMARQAAFGGALNLEYRVARKDGTVAWISLSAHTVILDGQMVYYSSCQDITKTKKNLDDIYNAKREIDVMANSIPGGVIKIRMSDFKLIYANDGYYLLTGYSRPEFHMEFGEYADTIIYEDDIDNVRKSVAAALTNQGLLGFEFRIVSRDGEKKWIYVNGRRIDDVDGEAVYLCVLMDITTRKQMEADFEDSAKRAELISDFLQETMWTYNVNSKKLVRSGSLDNTYSNESVLSNIFDLENMSEYMHPDDVDRFEDDLKEAKKKPQCMRNKYRIKNGKGNYQNIEISMISVSASGEKNPDKIYGVTRIIDVDYTDGGRAKNNVTNRIMAMVKSAQSKSKDNITGLMPYSAFISKADKILKGRGEKDKYALVCADIIEFNKFNHHYGFSVSNEILKIFSNIILNTIAKDGICSRVDGDYFIAMFKYERHKDLMQIMSGMLRSKEEFDKREGNIKFGTTSGIYLIQQNDSELADMLERADLARRSIKGLMGNHYAIYTDDLQKERFKEEEIIDRIFKSIGDNSIEICYMPRIKDNKENVVGCKAVPRVLMEDGHYIESVQLLRFIERGGRLQDFAFACLSIACCNMGAWKKKGNRTVPMSIEITASELSMQDAADKIDDIVITQNGLSPEDIIFEINERYFADCTTVFEMSIQTLCQRGYNVVISRFGSDHTAVNALKRLPITGIKFHGEHFNENMAAGREKIIFKKIVDMAKELGMTVTCGGIHTQLQEDFAKEIGCDMLEGDMYYGKIRNNVLEKCFLTD